MPWFAFVLGGISRVIDGTGKVKGSVWLMVAVAAVVGYWSTHSAFHAVLIAGGSGWALQRGFDGWERFSLRQLTQYFPALIPAVIIYGDDPMVLP